MLYEVITHKCAASFGNTQNGNERFNGLIQQNANDALRPYSLLPQIMGKLIAAPVQLAIGDAFVSADGSNRLFPRNNFV